MKRLLCGVALVGGLVGCDGGRGLEDVRTLQLNVYPEKSHAFLMLDFGACDSISSEVQAELDGMPMVLSDRGGAPGLLEVGGGDCVPPAFFLEVPEGVAFPTLDGLLTSVRVRQGDMERVAEIKGLCSERRLRLVTPASGVVRPGEPVEVAIEPGTDTLHEPFVAWVTDPSGRTDPRYFTEGDGRELTPERIRFVAPSGPGPDSAIIRLTGRTRGYLPLLRQQATRCEGFIECLFDCGVEPVFSLDLPVRVER